MYETVMVLPASFDVIQVADLTAQLNTHPNSAVRQLPHCRSATCEAIEGLSNDFTLCTPAYTHNALGVLRVVYCLTEVKQYFHNRHV